jgi:hypothetical protein
LVTTDAYTATASPSHVQPGVTRTYTIRLRNESPAESARQAAIDAPDGFNIDQTDARATTSGCPDGADWIVNATNSLVSAVWPGEAGTDLCPGGVLTFTFPARAADAEGLYTWRTGLRRGPNDFTPHSQPTVRVDGTRPSAPSIAGGPASPTNQTSATFLFSDSEGGLDFTCRLDSAAFAPCKSPRTYTGLSDGAHVFRVRASDAAGNDSPASVFEWRVDTVAPDTAISSGPAAQSNIGAAIFAFTSTEGGAGFTCSLDGSAFASCVSPTTYGSLANGTHVFRVRATDGAGNTDSSPAALAWAVNTRGPLRTDRTPPGNVRNVAKSVGYRKLRLRWRSPSDRDFHHVLVVVGKNPKKPPATPVYRGRGTRYVDSKFKNGFYHRYAITSYDRAGNASRKVTLVVRPDVLLKPRAGTRVRKAPLLDWASVPRATYYNVQLYRGSRKILSAWPGRSRLKLRPTWSYEDAVNRLSKGTYRWYVWPGFGRRSLVRYGQLLGQGSFAFNG